MHSSTSAWEWCHCVVEWIGHLFEMNTEFNICPKSKGDSYRFGENVDKTYYIEYGITWQRLNSSGKENHFTDYYAELIAHHKNKQQKAINIS